MMPGCRSTWRRWRASTRDCRAGGPGVLRPGMHGLRGTHRLPGDRLCAGLIVSVTRRCPARPRAARGGRMTDDRELAGLDPFALLDDEARRLDAFLSGLGGSGWQRASRCAGWTVRDVLGHLAAGEDYHRACLDGTVAAFLASFAGRGGTDLDSVNALGVAGYAALSPEQVLARWRAASAGNRRRFRERADGVVDTSAGGYPCRWQAFHVAAELATHAADIGVPVTHDEHGRRTAWPC